MELQRFFDDFYRPLRLRGKSQNTTRLYGCLIRQFSRWLGHDATISDMDELVFARYLEHRAATRSPYTAEKERSQLMALAALAWERRMLDHKPSCPPAPLPDRVPTAWSIDELQRLMAAAENPSTWKHHGRYFSRFFSALIPTLYEVGERIGAILEARVADYQRPTILVRAEARKGCKRDRLYKLTDATCDRIERVIESDSDRLFPWPFAESTIYRHFGLIVAAAGLDTRDRLRFHQIRRSAASHFKAAGGDATAMLDHSSPRITQRWYLDPRLCDTDAKPCDILPPITRAAGDAPITPMARPCVSAG